MYVLYSELYCGILSNYCLLLLLQRSLSVPSLEPLLLLTDGHHLLLGLFKTYYLLYCYANGCTTYDCIDRPTEILI